MHAVNILLFPKMLQQDQIGTIRNFSVYRRGVIHVSKKLSHDTPLYNTCTASVQ